MSSNRSKKKGVNSAYRKMERDHQDSHRAMVIGVAGALLLLCAIVLGHSKASREDHPTSSNPAAEVVQYARGAPPIEAVDSMIDGDSGHR